MLMNQSFIRNLLIFALCVFWVQAAPIKVRRSRESGSFEEPLLKRTPLLKPDAFAPYRFMKRAASASTSASPASVSVSVSTVTVTSTATTTVSVTANAQSSTATPSAETVTLTQSPSSQAPPAAKSAVLPGAIQSSLGSFPFIGTGSAVIAPPSAQSSAGAPPAVSGFGSFPFIGTGSAAIVSPTAQSAPSTVSSAPPTGTTVTVDIGQVQSGFSSALVAASSSAAAASGTTVTSTVSGGNPLTASTPVVGTQALPSSTCDALSFFNDADIHADPTTNIPLWKAVPDSADTVTSLVSNPNPPRNEKGDFSSSGAFYLTDTWQAAAQAACYASGQPVDKVAVIQYNWTPTQDMKITEFQNSNVQWRAFVDASQGKGKSDPSVVSSDMIVGPLDARKDITTTFWQYAVNSDKAMQNLDLVSVFQPVLCANIPRGNCLPFQTL